jgi:hypothetical protein
MAVDGQRHTPAALPPGKSPTTHCTGDWLGLGAGLEGWGKCRPQLGFEPQTFQPALSRYTD